LAAPYSLDVVSKLLGSEIRTLSFFVNPITIVNIICIINVENFAGVSIYLSYTYLIIKMMKNAAIIKRFQFFDIEEQSSDEYTDPRENPFGNVSPY
jgi:hypothetical protein